MGLGAMNHIFDRAEAQVRDFSGQNHIGVWRLLRLFSHLKERFGLGAEGGGYDLFVGGSTSRCGEVEIWVKDIVVGFRERSGRVIATVPHFCLDAEELELHQRCVGYLQEVYEVVVVSDGWEVMVQDMSVEQYSVLFPELSELEAFELGMERVLERAWQMGTVGEVVRGLMESWGMSREEARVVGSWSAGRLVEQYVMIPMEFRKALALLQLDDVRVHARRTMNLIDTMRAIKLGAAVGGYDGAAGVEDTGSGLQKALRELDSNITGISTGSGSAMMLEKIERVGLIGWNKDAEKVPE